MSVQQVRRDALVDMIRSSGMGIEEFAAKVMGRSSSTLYRWLQGSRPIPDVVADWMQGYGSKITDAIKHGGREG